jgi:hypothetical protein
MKRVIILILSLTAAAIGCQRSAETPRDDKTSRQIDDLTRKIDELKQLLAEMKQNTPAADAAFRNWLATCLIPGKTTLDEVKSVLGTSYFNLDRPERDSVLTIQYSLDDLAGKKLILDFTKLQAPELSMTKGLLLPRDRPLIDTQWTLEKKPEIGFFFCGYCPHILVDAGGWRLEGKMLPGAVGASRARSDVLVLPRALPKDGKVNIKLANWAPEMEHLDRIELGMVASEPGEQLDFSADGAGYLWRENHWIQCSPPQVHEGQDRWVLNLPEGHDVSVLVLELRNTEAFQDLARQCYSSGAEPNADLRVASPNVTAISPVGTKFFRRVVVPIIAETIQIKLSAPSGMWWVRNAWLGIGRHEELHWLAADRSRAVSKRPQMHDWPLILEPEEEAILSFTVPAKADDQQNWRCALRMSGYYEILSDR